MSLLDEFCNSHVDKPTDPAKKVLFAVMNDLLDRSGFDNAWDGFDEDVMEEILGTNLEIVREHMCFPQGQAS